VYAILKDSDPICWELCSAVTNYLYNLRFHRWSHHPRVALEWPPIVRGGRRREGGEKGCQKYRKNNVMIVNVLGQFIAQLS
jgi:hypothetical protein